MITRQSAGNISSGMAILLIIMTISVTQLKSRLLEIIREVEREGRSVDVERHGRVVARLIPAASGRADGAPWTRLRGSARLLAEPAESVLDESEFEALE